MNCHDMKSRIPELLFEPEIVIAEESAVPENASVNASVNGVMTEPMRAHLAECDDCRTELEELRATMSLRDEWKAPEPNPYFLTRLNAQLEEEREAAPVGWPQGWYNKLRARVVYGSRHSLRPVAAMALTAAVLISGGAYLGLNELDTQTPAPQAAVVHDLQTMDSNAQLLDQLEALSSQND